MKAGFDWIPLLSEGEVVVWEGRPSRLQIFAYGAVITAVATAGWFMAMGEVAQASGGAECLSVDCPTAGGKAGFVVYFAGPVSIFFGAWLLLLSASIRQVGAVTSKRVLSLSYRLWSKQPTLKQVPVTRARAMLNAAPLVTSGLLVSNPPSSQRIILWAKSRAELKRAESMIEKLSSGKPLVEGPTP